MPKWVCWPDLDMMQLFEAEFRTRGGIPGVVGAMDGTYIHCRGQGPHCEDFENRKGFFSIICQLMCDSMGLIWDFFVGYPGSVNDARVFINSPARVKIEEGGFLDFTLVADAAYGLTNYIYTPYRALPGRSLPDEQRVWNLQQSRTRMIVEQINGRLKTRWRILDERLEYDVFRAPQVVSACIALHNIDLVLGFRPCLSEPRERNTWWLEGPVADAPHISPRDYGFTPTRRRTLAWWRTSTPLGGSDILMSVNHRLAAGLGRRETPRPRSATPACAPMTSDSFGEAVDAEPAGSPDGAGELVAGVDMDRRE
ncbi:unnamed protein product [Closterium sp. Yama58-4]|nr:unnamed protein product [Closterium sp. Yama58-4]